MAAKARKVRQKKALKFLYVGRFLDGDFHQPVVRFCFLCSWGILDYRRGVAPTARFSHSPGHPAWGRMRLPGQPHRGDLNLAPNIRQEFLKRHPLALVLEGDLHFCKPHTRQCFRSPQQGFTGLRVVTQAEWPGLWLVRPVGAGQGQWMSTLLKSRRVYFGG